MPPNSAAPTGVLLETDDEVSVQQVLREKRIDENYVPEFLWLNVSLYSFLHINALYGIYLMFTSASIYTIFFTYFLYILGGLGITAGVHRLWAHRSYKAKWPLRLMLAAFNTLAFQDAVIHWARDHRLHHKYSETDADPHNALRGFFFCHIGWLLCRKHPLVTAKGKLTDMSDLYADPILRYQKKYYLYFLALICFIIPTFTPMYLWNESFVNAFTINLFRYAFTLHSTWLVNSAAHMFGDKPYDKFINPAQNITVAILALGEGWHNYHHTFPWDYKTSELGKYSTNFSTAFIDIMAKIGWAYELKTVSTEMVQKRVHRTGDGTHNLWGWGDKDQSEEERNDAVITYKKD